MVLKSADNEDTIQETDSFNEFEFIFQQLLKGKHMRNMAQLALYHSIRNIFYTLAYSFDR